MGYNCGKDNPKFNFGFTYTKRMKRWRIHCRDGSQVRWSRIVYQNYCLGGQEIPEGAVIHHKNKDSGDDNPENLELKISSAEHLSKAVVLVKDCAIMEFDSAKEAGHTLGLSRSVVSMAINRNYKVRGWKPCYL